MSTISTRFMEENTFDLIKKMSESKLVFIDRKKNREFRNNYKEVIYKLNANNYKYSDLDNNERYKGETVHIFGYKDLYIKVKLTDGICKILSLHVAKYAL